MKLYTYFRSSAAFRVRIALNLKGLSYDAVPVHLVRDGGEQKKPAYRAVNPQGRLPSLVVDHAGGEAVLTQSLAIIEYLDEIRPEPPLLPADPVLRARARAAALLVACDIHPLNNPGTTGYLRDVMGQPPEAIARWYGHFIRDGFAALEQMIAPGPYAFGGAVTVADLCIVPQVFNAQRFKVPLDDFPKLLAVNEACMALEAFAKASPGAQPDAE